jgi:hypothetical protein
MSFSFKPMTNEEIKAIQNRDLLPEGTYSFTVKSTESQKSSSGNAMLKIRICILDNNRNDYNIFDYLVATDKMMFKLKHFCESVDLKEEYNKGTLYPNDCNGRSGKVIIGIQKGKAKDDGTGFYPDKNCVKDYIGLSMAEVDLSFNDDITF